MCQFAPRGVQLVHGEDISRFRISPGESSRDKERAPKATIDLEQIPSPRPVNLLASLATGRGGCTATWLGAHHMGRAATEV